jgi:hypothetical protein
MPPVYRIGIAVPAVAGRGGRAAGCEHRPGEIASDQSEPRLRDLTIPLVQTYDRFDQRRDGGSCGALSALTALVDDSFSVR